MRPKRILVLGGTTEAREAADALAQLGHHVIFSLAGVTTSPQLPSTDLRQGGFGGTAGLVTYLRDAEIDLVLDATHPFAAMMSRQAHEACGITGVALARLERPAWQPPLGANWVSVCSVDEAANVLPTGARVLLTTGRKNIELFTSRLDLGGLVRAIEPPATALPATWQLLQDRPPFTLDGERALLAAHAITHLVSKNAGSHATAAKLEAAQQKGVAIIMVERPEKPQCLVIPNVEALLARQADWLGRSIPKP